MDDQTAMQPPAGPAAMSFSDKLMNVFASPSALYEDVARGPKSNANWVVPLIVTILLSIIFSIVVFSQPPIKAQAQDQQIKALQERLAQGKMTQEQYNQYSERMPEPGSPIFLIFANVFGAFFLFAALFISALAFWISGKTLMKSTAQYMKIVEVVGLATWVTALGTIITMIIMVAAGSLYVTPSLAVLVSNFDPASKVDKLLASVNLFTLWYLGIISVGLSKLFPSSVGKSIGVVAVLWVLWTAIAVFLGIGGM